MSCRKQEILFVDLNKEDFKVTKKTKEKSIGNINLPARQKLGLFRTDDENKEYISNSFKRKLP